MHFRDDPKEYCVALFVESIQDPSKPKHCGKCLVGCVSTIFLCAGGVKHIQLVAFYDAAVRFLSAKRTSSELSSLIQTLTRCSCDMDSQPVQLFHMQGSHMQAAHTPVNTTNTALALVETLFTHLAHILAATDGSHLVNGNQSHWPRDVSDIVVYSPEILVDSVKMWMTVLPNPASLDFFSRALLLCGEPLVRALLDSHDFLMSLNATILAIVQHTREAEGPLPTYGPDDEYIPILTVYCFLSNFVACITPGDRISAWVRNSNVQPEFLRTFRVLLDLLRDPAQRPKLRMQPKFISAFGGILVHLGTLVTDKMDLPIPPELEPDMWLRLETSDPRIDAGLNEMERVLLNAPKCGWWHCVRTALKQGGKPFRRCTGCYVTSYCSSQCQSSDWKNEQDLPHKQTCPVIQRAVKEGGIDVNGRVVFWLQAKRNLLKGDFMKDEKALYILGRWGEEGDERRKNPYTVTLPDGLGDPTKMRWAFSNDDDSDSD